MQYKRVLIKISGEFFGGPEGQGLNFEAIQKVANEIASLHKTGMQITIINGGGNIFRGRTRPDKFDEETAHKIGIVSTLPNALALSETLRMHKIKTAVMCSFKVGNLINEINKKKAINLLENQNIVIFTGGTGRTFVTNDTAAIERAIDIKAEAVLKATDVDGVYSADPNIDKQAKRYQTLSYKQVIDKNLKIMDKEAFELAQKHQLKIIVFKFEPGSLVDILKNSSKGTIVN